MTIAEMKAYALYLKADPQWDGVTDETVKQHVVVVARSPKEAASILGGDYSEPEGGRKTSVTYEHREELYFVGTVSFAPELFRKMDETDCIVAGIYGGSGTYIKGLLHLLTHGNIVELLMYEYGVMLPDYVLFQGYDT